MRPLKLTFFNSIFIIFIFITCNPVVFAQTYLNTTAVPGNEKILNNYSPSAKQSDSISTIRSINKMLAELYDDGYLSASIENITGNKDTMNVLVFAGEQYRWMNLRNGNLDEGMLSEAGFREKLYDNKPLKPGGIFKLNQKILNYCENNGYPFASLHYDSFAFENSNVSAMLMLNSGTQITIDSVIIRGNSKLSRTYLYSYLSVKPGDLYNESTIKKIPSRIKELPMVSEIRPFSVAFTEETARIILQIDDKKASQIDGIIGILPDNEEAGKVQVTGDLRIRLLSSFGKGELFDLNWKQPAAKTQDLKVRLNYPFLFGSPFGIDLNLGIYKKDTSYLEVDLGFGVQFLLKGGNYLKVFLDDKNSTLLSTTAYENTTTLPPFADVRNTTYGLGFRSLKLDYRLNPRKGYSLDVIAGVGNRKITQNGRLNPEIYDSLELKTVQYNGEGTLDFYLPFFSRNVLNLGVKGGALSSDDTFENELYRIGGLNSLRGFDEESITASAYTIAKSEVRYILEQNSYLFVFYNIAWYERNLRTSYINDIPFGFGAGLTFETKLGIFSFSYALGKEFNNPIRIRAAKIHFGLINYF